ncbi:hypothetical protein OG497_37805 [Streptomyces sp. NBC_01242]|uniref:hypothetical protein n=1 Tax=Streptomyces sp. NBC_01242 TaxID=2903795 RepID=UPI00225309BA|nr:hypothetical protein [Streptomyces sp. NBC_01242]MCX4799614.1 hypothetical protein [Streptomyces sp. NBC_01242]
MTVKPRLTAHAPTVSREIRPALDGTGIPPGAFRYTVTQAARDVVEIEWHGPEGDALDAIAKALDGPYDVERTTPRRGTQSSFSVDILRITPGTPVTAVQGTEATADDVTAPSYAYRTPWDAEGTAGRHGTAAEARNALNRVRADGGTATIDHATGVITLHLGKDRTERYTLTPSTPEQRAAHRRELHRSARHWADQARRDSAKADSLRAALDTAPEERRYHLRTRIHVHEEHAQKAQEAADKAAADAATLDDQPAPQYAPFVSDPDRKRRPLADTLRMIAADRKAQQSTTDTAKEN